MINQLPESLVLANSVSEVVFAIRSHEHPRILQNFVTGAEVCQRARKRARCLAPPAVAAAQTTPKLINGEEKTSPKAEMFEHVEWRLKFSSKVLPCCWNRKGLKPSTRLEAHSVLASASKSTTDRSLLFFTLRG